MPCNPRWLRALTLAALLGSGACAAAESSGPPPGGPEGQGVAVQADDLPGLDQGAALFDRLRVAQVVLASGVAKEAAHELDWLIGRINALLMRGMVAWPASYQRGGELWVPVDVQAVQVRLDVPETLPRPDRAGRRERPEDLRVEARRVDWLPLEPTRALLVEARQGIPGEGDVPAASQERLAQALAGIRQTVRLRDPMVGAYRAAKAVLAGGATWQGEGRDDLRQAADELFGADATDPAARELADLAQGAAPDVGRLAVVAGQLRRRIEAREFQGAAPAGAPPPSSRGPQGRGDR